MDYVQFSMTLFHDYSQHGELLQTRDEILTEQHFPRYFKQYGEHQAQTYYETLRDIVARTTVIVAPKTGGKLDRWYDPEPRDVKRDLIQLFKEKQEELTTIQELLQKDNLDKVISDESKSQLLGEQDALSDAVSEFDDLVNERYHYASRHIYSDLARIYNPKKTTFLSFVETYFQNAKTNSLSP